MANYSSFQTQQEILNYWKTNNTFKALQGRNKDNKPFSFLDGPITANNPMGVHHAWGRTLKDLYQRYKSMQGFHQRYQNGFDCQGLWLEVETEKDLGFNSKKDIEHYGLDNFSKACRQRVEKYSHIQTEQSQLLGQWMDWGNDYYTMSDDNIQAIWHFLKVCHDHGWLYKGRRILPWCIRCGTSSSKHEMSDEGYEDLTHTSVYVKAKIKGRTNEYLLIWTTTEWTLSSNIAAAVNPDITYVQAKQGNDLYYLSEATAHKLGGDAIILNHLKGIDLLGLEYENFYPALAIQHGITPKVVPFEGVGEKDGTGIVHLAPNCGDVDYDLGIKLNLPLLDSALDEYGTYTTGYGWLTGKNVRDVKKAIITDLEARGILFKTEEHTHRYPVCWRCKEELVFRLDSSWFLSCQHLRPKMKRAAAKVEWYPEHVGKLMQDWLDNMEDWNISRRRYWGLPLMFYECGCGSLTVIGSREELRTNAVNKTAVDNLPELHRPWIDAIKITCACGKEVERIKEIGDCWLDAGIVPFSTLRYFNDKDYWKAWFPADLEIEMRAQVRLWFYAQLFMSVVLEGRAPYKKVLAYEEVRDEHGQPMHKSKGNAIWFNEAVEKMGADVMRWQYCSQNPHSNLNFGYGPARDIQKYLIIIQNLATYIQQFCTNPSKGYSKDLPSLWILSRREHLKKNVTEALDNLEYHRAMEALKNFFLFDLSKTYIHLIRDKAEERKIQKVLYDTYLDAVTLLAPFLPFTTEKINLETYHKDSIHLQPWPKPKKKFFNLDLEHSFSICTSIIQGILAARDKQKINVRWPLKKATVTFHNEHSSLKEIVLPLKDLILTQTNLKDLDFLLSEKALVQGLETPFDYGLVLLDTTLTPSLEQEGYTRELIRRIQSLRKEANLQKKDKITLYIQTRYDLGSWIKTLKKKVGAKKLIIRTRAPRMAFEKTIAATLRDNTFTLYLSKLSL
ncbi:MAG TPA: isoleucine--tRNA ligase [Candidatus Nanoarchaeia archaeon]|nr:isoleucine--tRNA ligase [Candidatus Nanoarchaeia archaeon]